LSIIVPESRELDLFAGLLESEGAAAIRCPLVQITDLDDVSALDAWINRLIAGEFDDLILLTGEGLRRIVARADQLGRMSAAVAALKPMRTIIRGPKPARALRELGLSPGISAATPTSEGVVDALAGLDLQGRKIGVQLYPGKTAGWIVEALKAKGALVSEVTPYRYASEAETGEVAGLICRMAAGEVGMIAFTSSPQVERLVEVAHQQKLEKELAQGLSRARVAAIGPIVEQALKKHGFSNAIVPKTPHLKPFVRAITDAWPTAR
jgi:uroporphyrinogen-III synthase